MTSCFICWSCRYVVSLFSLLCLCKSITSRMFISATSKPFCIIFKTYLAMSSWVILDGLFRIIYLSCVFLVPNLTFCTRLLYLLCSLVVKWIRNYGSHERMMLPSNQFYLFSTCYVIIVKVVQDFRRFILHCAKCFKSIRTVYIFCLVFSMSSVWTWLIINWYWVMANYRYWILFLDEGYKDLLSQDIILQFFLLIFFLCLASPVVRAKEYSCI